MILSNIIYNPYIRANDTASKVMTDVVIALLPCIIISSLAYGFYPIAVVLIAIASALTAEFLFSALFNKNTDSIGDGSAIVTGILLAFTLGPFTPLYIVAFGGATAVLFGKMLWGGLGRNRFNPALTGREFMTIFFPATMNSGYIWKNEELLNITEINVFGNDFLNDIFYKVSGSIGEYSPFFLIIGGLYLLIRRRITWHIPFGMLTAFIVLLFVFSGYDIRFSFGGLFLGAIYMATDMPTSASNPIGKVYFGAMVGLVCIMCLAGGVTKGYFSYAVLLMNGFVEPINWILRPRVWGRKWEALTRLWQMALITLAIIATAVLVIYIHHLDGIKYIIYFFIGYSIIRFILMRMNKNILDSK